MKPPIIIQARSSSKRLPNKIFLNIGEHSVIEHVMIRCLGTGFPVALAYGGQHHHWLSAMCKELGVRFSHGPVFNVLGRFTDVAADMCLIHGTDAVVRICGDCPMVSPYWIGELVRQFDEYRPDVAALSVRDGFGQDAGVVAFPEGMDAEVVSLEALQRTNAAASLPEDREHVTSYLWKHSTNTLLVEAPKDYGEYKWSIDTNEDYHRVRELMEHWLKFDAEFEPLEMLK